ncbi:hypothetical protein FACS1894122_12330 [Alphaproteobacteria bacterium]|nr:hypothetical protein FACS1894122_12330 [Alphaproteobacteria bacterium]
MKKILAIAVVLQVFDLYGMIKTEGLSSSTSNTSLGEVKVENASEDEYKLTIEGFLEQFSFLPLIIGKESGKYNAELAFILCKLSELADLQDDTAIVAVLELPFKEWRVTGCLDDQHKARIEAIKILDDAKRDENPRSIIAEKNHEAFDMYFRFKRMEKDLCGFMEARGFDNLPLEMQQFIKQIGLKKLDKKG